jgi:hypothetical protein
MKNFEVQELLKGLSILRDVKLKGKVAYAVIRNIEKLSSVEKTIEETRKKLAEDLCEKDAEGKPVIEENAYKISEDNKAEFNKQYIELLDSEADIELHKIDENLVDELDLTLEQASYLFQITK